MLRQITTHVMEQRQAEKEQLEQQEQDKSVSCISHKLGGVTNGSDLDYIDINGRKYTVTGKHMESVFKLLKQIDSELETLPDRDMIRRFKMILKPFREEISKQSGVEYKIASGIMKPLNELERRTKITKDQYWEQKLGSMNNNVVTAVPTTTTPKIGDDEEVIV